MNRKLILLVLLFISISAVTSAQNIRFVKEGIITYERTINTYAIMEKKMSKSDNAFKGPMMDGFKKSQSQFKTLKSTLYFSKNQTLFKPTEDTSPPVNYFGPSPEFSQLNTIFSDLSTHQQVTQKSAFEEIFLVKDNTRKIKWKITTETREIAGYSCRRANAIVLDSIYVVAFYTEQIPVSGGPESFNGLPGMILGVALPHENVTWFAKTVTDKVVDSKVMVAPAKGKVTDNKGLTATLLAALKDYWGADSNPMLKMFML